jgi:RNA polymerase sigma-70 factor (ECF subfamily)
MTGVGKLLATAKEDTATADTARADFDLAYRTHFAEVHRFVFRLVNDPAVADELTQDAFLNAYRAWDGFRGEASMRTWLFRIARNTSVDYLRNPRSRHQTHAFESIAGPDDSEATDGEMPAGAEPQPGVATEVQRIEMTECVRRFIADLPETLRTPLVLHDLEGFTNAEIAELVECSLEAAKMRLHRARHRLRELVDERCDLFHDERNVLSCLPGPPKTRPPAFRA